MKNYIKLEIDIQALVEKMLESNDWDIMEFYSMEEDLIDVSGRYDAGVINNSQDYYETIDKAIAYSYKLGLINALRYITEEL